jgi:hypothetical protein
VKMHSLGGLHLAGIEEYARLRSDSSGKVTQQEVVLYFKPCLFCLLLSVQIPKIAPCFIQHQ